MAAPQAGRRGPEGGSPDLDGRDDLATGVVDRGGDRGEPGLELAHGGGVASPAGPGGGLEEGVPGGGRPLGGEGGAPAAGPAARARGGRGSGDGASAPPVPRAG